MKTTTVGLTNRASHQFMMAMTVLLAGSEVLAQTIAFRVMNLVSAGSLSARRVDPDFFNPGGLIFEPDGGMVVINGGTGTAELFDRRGEIIEPSIFIPAARFVNPAGSPTSVIVNTESNAFTIFDGFDLVPAQLLFTSSDGVISAFSRNFAFFDPLAPAAVVAFDASDENSVFTSAAIVTQPLPNDARRSRLFITDFQNNRVVVLNEQFEEVTTLGEFRDPAIPITFSPVSIANVDGLLMVAFARRGADDLRPLRGRGRGFVSIFDFDGVLVDRFIRRGRLNAPSAIVVAGSDFGRFSNAVLIGNAGDGRINAFDRISGRFIGTLRLRNGQPIQIARLRGLSFGNDDLAGPEDRLFFTSAPINDERGLFGSVRIDDR